MADGMPERLPLWNAVAQGRMIQRFCFVRQDWYGMGHDDDFSLGDFDFDFDFEFYRNGVKYLHPYRIKPGR